MTKKHWLILAAVVAACGLIAGALVLALTLGFFAGHEEASATGSSLPLYTSGQQLASSHPGYLHDTLTGGGEVYVNDYEEACLQLTFAEPQTVIGLMGSINPGKVGAIPSQPVTAYIAVDCGSEMPAYVPYRNIKQPPFDWRTTTFRQMTASQQYKFGPLVTTTNAALIAEVVRVLRDGTPVELNPFPFSGATNLTTINLTSSMNWTGALGLSSATGPNGDSASINYDTIARPQSSVSPYGATTTYAYNDTAPATRTATTNGHWTRTTLDGFGRTTKTETGDAGGTKSTVDTVYDSCGCNPLAARV